MRSISKYQDIVFSHFNALTLKKEPNNLYEPIKYILELGGKRLRPVLTLMACEVFDVDCKKAIPADIGLSIF